MKNGSGYTLIVLLIALVVAGVPAVTAENNNDVSQILGTNPAKDINSVSHIQDNNDVVQTETGIKWSAEIDGVTHTYEAVKESLKWDKAKEEATAKGGHLVTITDKDENKLIFDKISSNMDFWKNNSDGSTWGPWLGASKKDGYTDPLSGWAWVTGEDWEYTNWNKLQPDNSGGTEKYLQYWYKKEKNQTWNDIWASSSSPAYIIEWESSGKKSSPENDKPNAKVTQVQVNSEQGGSGNTNDWFIRGSILEGQMDYSGALDAYNKAIQLDPKNSVYLDSKARVLMILGRTEEANKIYANMLSV